MSFSPEGGQGLDIKPLVTK